MRRRILTLNLAPGSAISENELAGELGVSRTPVREALILLADEGLVQVFPQLGSFIAPVDPQRVRDAQFLRESVELASVRDLPEELDPAVVAALRQNLAAQQAPRIDGETFFDLDEAFHQGLLQLGGHGGVWPSIAVVKAHLDRARRLGASRRHTPAELAAEHAAVLEHVLAGDAEAAVAALRRHLRAVLDDVDRVQAESPELFRDVRAGQPVRRVVTAWPDSSPPSRPRPSS